MTAASHEPTLTRLFFLKGGEMTEERRRYWRNKYQHMRWEDLLRCEGIPFHIRGSGVVLANCVFHEEKTPSLKFCNRNLTYKCYGCGVSGHMVDFILEYHKGVGEPWIENSFGNMPIHNDKQGLLFDAG